ncbi:MAG: hypothetical protein ACTHKF_03030 [Candidatus Nitrosocosmicus sp.]
MIDKIVDITIGFSLGILILILHRRADKRVHEKIEKLHHYVTEEAASLISEMHKSIEKEQSIDENVHKMIKEQQKILHEIHKTVENEQTIEESDHHLIKEQQKILHEIHKTVDNENQRFDESSQR